MRWYLTHAIALLLGFGAGLISPRLRAWCRVAGVVPPPLDSDEYTRRLERNDQLYHDAMTKFDKLVPWVSGGALVVSLQFATPLARVAASSTTWILIVGWSALVLALLCSISSQYFSTRIQVATRTHLQLQQTPPAAGADDSKWRKDIRRAQCWVSIWGCATKGCNDVVIYLLLVGFLALGIWFALAIHAIPFAEPRI